AVEGEAEEPYVRDRLAAHVARGAVAEPVARRHRRARGGTPPQHSVTEAQPSRAVVVDLHHEVPLARTALEQVGAGAPAPGLAGQARVGLEQLDLRQRPPGILLQQRGGRRERLGLRETRVVGGQRRAEGERGPPDARAKASGEPWLGG